MMESPILNQDTISSGWYLKEGREGFHGKQQN